MKKIRSGYRERKGGTSILNRMVWENIYWKWQTKLGKHCSRWGNSKCTGLRQEDGRVFEEWLWPVWLGQSDQEGSDKGLGHRGDWDWTLKGEDEFAFSAGWMFWIEKWCDLINIKGLNRFEDWWLLEQQDELWGYGCNSVSGANNYFVLI